MNEQQPDERRNRPRDADATRAALLRAATAEFAKRGYAGARVDAIADQARTNKRMIYAYFSDKDGLYREVLSTRLAVPPFSSEETADPRSELTALIRWYFHLLAADPDFARLIAWGMLSGATNQRTIMLSSAAPLLELLTNVLQRGIASKVFRQDIGPDMIGTTIVSICLGYFLQHDAMLASRESQSERWTDEEFLEGICRIVFDGISTKEVCS